MYLADRKQQKWSPSNRRRNKTRISGIVYWRVWVGICEASAEKYEWRPQKWCVQDMIVKCHKYTFFKRRNKSIGWKVAIIETYAANGGAKRRRRRKKKTSLTKTVKTYNKRLAYSFWFVKVSLVLHSYSQIDKHSRARLTHMDYIKMCMYAHAIRCDADFEKWTKQRRRTRGEDK